MGFKTDYARVQGLGRAGEGVHHFMAQRLTAMALVPVVILFVVPFGRALAGGYDAVIATYSDLGNALTAILFIGLACWHFSLGLQVVIEDYVSTPSRRLTLIILTRLLSAAMASSGILAVATILMRG